MSVSEQGARIAAGKLRITVAEYRQHEAIGEAWCSRHRTWHPVEAFGPNAGRVGGRSPVCRQRAATDVTHFSLTPEGAVVATSANAAWSAPTACAQNATTAPSGHIYRTVTVMDPIHACEIAELGLMWGRPVSVVTRDGQRRAEVSGS